MARGTVYNNVVSEGNYDLVLKENKQLLEEFCDYLNSIDRSDLTVKNYTSDIKIFFIWNLENNNNKYFVDFAKRDLIKFQNYMLNIMHLSSNRIRRLRASLSSMSNYIEAIMDDLYPNFRNIINKIPAPAKNPVREKTILQDEDIQKLLDYLVENKEYQQACALALAWGSGSRKSELLRFKTSFFDEGNILYGSLYKTPEKIKSKGRSKAGKLIFKYTLKNKFKPYFDLWMIEREKLGININDLLVIKKDDQWQCMTEASLNYYAESFGKYLNVDFYWHSLRHNFTTGLVSANVPANIIKDISSWDSTSMIDIYDDNQVDDILGEYFDENGIKEIEKKDIKNL